MCRKLTVLLLCSILLTGCGRMTEETSGNNIPAGANIEMETDDESETIESTEPEIPEPSVTEETEPETTEPPTDAIMETSPEPELETLETILEEQSESMASLIPDIHLGMTIDEVFAVVGETYDYTYTDDLYKNTVEYDYIFSNMEIDGVEVPCYVFFEFDADTQLLLCCGYHFGHNGDFDAPEYPLSEEELAGIYNYWLEKLTEWYGEPDEPEFQTETPGMLGESAWENDEGKFWLMYGVNLWGWESFEGFEKPYEQGINEVIVSCSAR